MKGDPNESIVKRFNMTENQKSHDKEFHHAMKRFEPSSEDSGAHGWFANLFGKNEYYVFKKGLVEVIQTKCEEHNLPYEEFTLPLPVDANAMLNHSEFCDYMADATIIILALVPLNDDDEKKHDKDFDLVKKSIRIPNNGKHYLVSKSGMIETIERKCSVYNVPPTEILKERTFHVNVKIDHFYFCTIMAETTKSIICTKAATIVTDQMGHQQPQVTQVAPDAEPPFEYKGYYMEGRDRLGRARK